MSNDDQCACPVHDAPEAEPAPGHCRHRSVRPAARREVARNGPVREPPTTTPTAATTTSTQHQQRRMPLRPSPDLFISQYLAKAAPWRGAGRRRRRVSVSRRLLTTKTVCITTRTVPLRDHGLALPVTGTAAARKFVVPANCDLVSRYRI